jgi:hypothetical protein
MWISRFPCPAETDFQHHVFNAPATSSSGRDGRLVCHPEDLILLKLLAGRPKDRIDVGDILFIQGQLDEAYLREWASRLGVADLLNEMLGSH